MRRSVLMTRLVARSPRVGLTRTWTRRVSPAAALRVADDPAHRVPGRNRPRPGERFARLESDVGHLARRGVDLVQRALGERVDLDRA